jgi:flagellar hook-associated protein 3 FlgL
MLKNLSNSYSRLAKLQDQISTQKKFTKPSDDPVAAMMGMNYRSDVNKIDQYTRNIGEVNNWVNSTDDALNHAVNILQRARELTVQASNGTYDGDQRQAIAEEIQQIKDQIKDIGDTQIGDKYIFNGKDTNLRPSDNGFSTGEVRFEVFSGITMPANVEGKPLFENANTSIQDLYDSLMNNDSNIGDHLATIDATINKFLGARSVIGAKQNRVELMENRLGSQEVFSKEILSNNEDIDIEKAITEFTTQESVHSAALSIGSRIIQPSLVDFLR